ncbi:hypothetical protein DFR29_114162 [Tahibacter aquaticus]|uniref:Uncharacterized protein n=1 Tax=Tahibacter aquaticus TaxID=520092 RepID=A0A4R6YQE0_9GAMM|nr:hypothetical protein [Tahibacter aquaticus]TDR40110.1 hypothetical protein DFR29_114162 [Tahibacter aquaticus]
MFPRALPTLVLLLAAAPALAIDYSDHWWNPDRSGRGIMIEQRGDQAYAIVYDYRDNGTPVWYIAPQLTVAVEGPDYPPILTGALQRMFFNGDGAVPPLDADQVGEISIIGQTAATARVAYTVSGTTTVQLMRRLDYGQAQPQGRYLATIVHRPAGGTMPVPAEQVVTTEFTATTTPAGSWTLSSQTLGPAGLVRCTYSATAGAPLYVQTGRVAELNAVSLCNGVAGTFTLRNIEFTSQGFSARIDETGVRSVVGGQLAAVKVGAAGG